MEGDADVVPAGLFHPSNFPRGAKYRLLLTVEAAGHLLEIPVLLARGAEAGACLVATAGVHGDEYEGVRAILDLFEELNPAGMCGDLLAVPVVNQSAFWAVSRTSMLDGLNLARVFPGNREGSPTDVLAWHLDRSVIQRADLYIDLHSGGVRYAMPALVGYLANDERARAAALAFGAEVLWEHPTIAAGRTVSAAHKRGIPALYTEAQGAGRIDSNDLQFLARGLRSLLRHLHILSDFDSRPKRPELVLGGSGNLDESILSSADGFLIPHVALLERVKAGQPLGILVDPLGRTIERYAALASGFVVLVHACPVVQVGEPVFLVAPESTAFR